MRSISIAALGMAVAAMAGPIVRSAPQTFTLAMTVGVGDAQRNVTLFARPYGNSTTTLEFVGCDEASIGTPVYANGTNPTSTVNAIYTDGEVYPLFAADLGEAYGRVDTVSATKGYPDPNWSVANGYVYHKLTAASNGLMACNRTINDQTKSVLSWGVYNDNYTLPYGCQFTTLYAVCNQPGSSAQC